MAITTLDRADEKSAENILLARLRERLEAVTFTGCGIVDRLIVSPKHDVHESVRSIRVAPDVGVEGDRPYKQWWRGKRMAGRQISAINAEVLDALGVGYDVPGDNLIIRGIDLAQLEEDDALKIGDAVLVATGTPHRPCKLFARRTSTAHYVAISKDRYRGTMFNSLGSPALIRVGDAVERIFL